MEEKTIVLKKERKVTLTYYRAKEEIAPAILILPGGGYTECSVNEGRPAAAAFNRLGFHAFVLCYSVGKHFRWPYPLEDYEDAMAHIKAHAEEYLIDDKHVAVAGFSAGGHLAGAAATMARTKPFAAILCYAALSRSTIEYTAPDAPDITDAVNSDTCPCFLASSRNDWIVPIDNTHRFIAALEKNCIDYESHIYGFSMHGFSVGREVNAVPPDFCSRVGDWVEESASWLRDLIDGSYISIRDGAAWQDANAEFFSSRNSVGLIFSDEEAKRAFRKKNLKYYLLVEAAQLKVGPFVQNVSIRNVLTFLNAGREAYEEIDKSLCEIRIKR